MKLAVINYSGNVGKTTVARHLLAPRMPDCQVVAVESINADDGQPVTIRGRQFAQLQEFLQSVDNVVVDIGASNVEELLKLMRRYQDSQEDFDGFIVPTVPARKQQQDTAATLAELARIGVPPDRLRVVFNQVDDDIAIDMADAARVALGAALGATLQRLQAAAQPRADAPRRRREPWLTHGAAAATASAVTWTAAIMLWGR
jgi:hypothetical protein